MTIEICFYYTTLVFSLGFIINQLEYLYIAINKERFNNFCNTDISILEHKLLPKKQFLSKLYHHIYSRKLFLIKTLLLIFLAVIIIFYDFGTFHYTFIITALFPLTLLSFYRTSFGGDGSDRMNIIVLTVIFISSIFSENTVIVKYGIYFIGAQTTLAYFVAGVSKLKSTSWRNGKGLRGLLNTNTYSYKFISHYINKNKLIPIILSWMVIIWEFLFPLSFFFNEHVFLAFLCTAFTFHLGCAIIMNLNSFIFSFVATYPCLYFIYLDLNHS